MRQFCRIKNLIRLVFIEGKTLIKRDSGGGLEATAIRARLPEAYLPSAGRQSSQSVAYCFSFCSGKSFYRTGLKEIYFLNRKDLWSRQGRKNSYLATFAVIPFFTTKLKTLTINFATFALFFFCFA